MKFENHDKHVYEFAKRGKWEFVEPWANHAGY